MKYRLPLLALGAALILGGCDSMSDSIGPIPRTAASRDDSRVRVFQADQRTTYAAALKATKALGYTFVRGGPAEGKLEALSPVSSDQGPESSRQIALRAHLEPSSDGGTQVTVYLKEIIESDSANQPGMATETSLRDTPTYEVFFHNLQDALNLPAKDQ